VIVYCNIKQHGIVEHYEMVRFIDNIPSFNFNLRLNMIVFFVIFAIICTILCTLVYLNKRPIKESRITVVTSR
jgi:hypothetical protein